MAPTGGTPPSRGLLLVHGAGSRVDHWVRRGLVATRVLEVGDGWSAVCPAESRSRTVPPYDDALSVLAARPIGYRLRPAVGAFVIDGKGVLTVQPAGLRAVQRWLVWAPGRGLLRPRHLPSAAPEDLLEAAGGEETPRAVRALRDLVTRTDATPVQWAGDLLDALGLPGRALLEGRAARPGEAGGRLVEPDHKAVRRFEELLADEGAIREPDGPGGSDRRGCP